MSAGASAAVGRPGVDLAVLDEIAKQTLWLSAGIVDAANTLRKDPSGLKVGGHQSSSASLVSVMTSLWFAELTATDRVSVKPHASPVLHAINYLLGDLPESYLPTLRARGGLQSYPSRIKDPDTVDFSTGSVGIGATATIWAAVARRFLDSRSLNSHTLGPAIEPPGKPEPGGRWIALVGDAELDEGAIWEAVADPMVGRIGELLWIVDLNRQSLDRVVPDVQIARLQGMFRAAGWQVLTCQWGHRLQKLFAKAGGDELQYRLEAMPNEEYQALLRTPAELLHPRLLHSGPSTPALRGLVEGLSPAALAASLRDLGGHDQALLARTYAQVDPERPTVLFAYTIKGWGLPTEGHPANHSALLNPAQMDLLATDLGGDRQRPWQLFLGDDARRLAAERAATLQREFLTPAVVPQVPLTLAVRHQGMKSTQSGLGRFLLDLRRAAPDVAARVVTLSPDVASSTNLGGWINRTGVWSVSDRRDWFADDTQRLVHWVEGTAGQHIELGIAETNLVGLLGELGATWSRHGQPLLPIATLYDPFVSRCLEPWSFGIYAGGQSILVGTPSGVTLAAEGGAHQSITSPSIGLEQPGCVAWEPAFTQDLEWAMLAALAALGRPGGSSAYFRLTTRSIDQELAGTAPNRREHCVAGGYRIRGGADDAVTLVGMGAVLPEVLAAADELTASGAAAGVVCVSSADLLFRDLQARRSSQANGTPDRSGILDVLFPIGTRTPIVTVLDGHPHTLAFLAGVRGSLITALGVTEFGQSSDLADAYALHGIDRVSIVAAARGLV